MSDVKISALPVVAQASLTTASDVVPIVHTGVTSATTIASLVKAVLVSPGAIGATTPAAGTFTALTADTLSLNSTLTVASLTITGNETVGGTLGVTGATTLAGLSATTGAFSGAVSLTSSLTVGTTLGVTGATSLAALSATTVTVGTGANAAVQKASFLGGYTVFENSAGTGNPSITFNNDTDTGFWNPAGNVIAAGVGGSKVLEIAAGAVSITGTHAVSGNATVGGTLGLSDNLNVNKGVSTVGMYVGPSGAEASFVYNTDGNLDIAPRSGFGIRLNAATSVTGALSATGNGLLGTATALARLTVQNSGNNGAWIETDTFAAPVLVLNSSAATGDNPFIAFLTDGAGGGGTTRGSISYNRGGGLVAYNTTSDYRSKTVLGDVTNSGELIDALRPHMVRMNGASMDIAAFVAHELQEVLPWAVTGDKDGEAMQQVNLASLVPLHTAELQALRARVAALEAA